MNFSYVSTRSKSVLLTTACILVSTIAFGDIDKASAVTLSFTGGICTFSDFSSGGLFLLYSCENKTGKTVNDIHLSISYVDSDGNPVPELNDSYNAKFPDIKPGGTYTIPGPLGYIVYNNREITIALGADVNGIDNVRLSGYWTHDEVPVPVSPCVDDQQKLRSVSSIASNSECNVSIPESQPVGFASAALLGAGALLLKRRKASFSNTKLVSASMV